MKSCVHALVFVLFCSARMACAAADRTLEAAIIPFPARLEVTSGSFSVESDTRIVTSAEPGAVAVAHYFGDLLFRTRALRPEIVQLENAVVPRKVIQFTLQKTGASADPESYQLEISAQGVMISAQDARGLFYGATTLWQILSVDTTAADSIRVPALRISDAPRLRWRGLMLDSAHQYQSVEFIKRFIDTMALHKLNVLHWRLSDDEAWRVEIRKYPRLAASRGPNSGSYSQGQISEIVAHAAQRHVTIVPGIELPAHAGAMIAAYPHLAAAPNAGQSTRLLNADDSTFGFIGDVLTEIAQLFPGDYIHIGGADLPKDQWKTSVRAQARMRELGLIDEQQLQRYFVQRVAALAHERGRRVIGWDQPSNTGSAAETVAMSSRGLDGALAAAAAGYDVVVSSFDALNFNHRQSSAGDEPPGVAEVITLQDVYGFDPAPVALGPEDLRHLMGMQANVWTDHARTEADVEAITFPRAAAVAEVAWSPAASLRWPTFVARLAPQLKRYSKLGIGYSDAAFRIAINPRPARDDDRVQIELSRQVSSGEIRYTLNGSEPTSRSAVYLDVLEIAAPVTVKAASFLNAQPLSSTVTLQVNPGSIATARTDK